MIGNIGKFLLFCNALSTLYCEFFFFFFFFKLHGSSIITLDQRRIRRTNTNIYSKNALLCRLMDSRPIQLSFKNNNDDDNNNNNNNNNSSKKKENYYFFFCNSVLSLERIQQQKNKKKATSKSSKFNNLRNLLKFRLVCSFIVNLSFFSLLNA